MLLWHKNLGWSASLHSLQIIWWCLYCKENKPYPHTPHPCNSHAQRPPQGIHISNLFKPWLLRGILTTKGEHAYVKIGVTLLWQILCVLRFIMQAVVRDVASGCFVCIYTFSLKQYFHCILFLTTSFLGSVLALPAGITSGLCIYFKCSRITIYKIKNYITRKQLNICQANPNKLFQKELMKQMLM